MTDRPPTPDELALFRTLTDFVNAPDWEASRKIYEANPLLHTDDAIAALAGMAAAMEEKGDADRTRILSIHRDLLVLIKEVGIEEAFSRVTAPPDESLLSTLADFVNAEDWNQSRAILEEHPELLGVQAGAAFEGLIQAAQQQNDERRTHLLTTHYALIQRVNEVGIEQAFAEVENPLDEERLQLIAEFVYAGSPAGSRAVLEANPALLEEETSKTLGRLIRDAQREGEDELALLLTIHRDLLRRAREEGIEAAYAGQTEPPSETMMQKVVQFVNADGLEGSRAMLEEHPDLLSDEGLEAFELLMQAAQAQGREEMVHHLQVYRDLLRLAQAQGVEEAFRYVSGPDALLNVLVDMSAQALHSDDDEMVTQWRGQLGQFNEQAQTLGDEPMRILTDAVARVFLGANPEKLNPPLEGAHAEAWQRIVAAYQQAQGSSSKG